MSAFTTTTGTPIAAPQTTALIAPTTNTGRELAFYGLDREQVDLVKRTVAKGATDDQLALFLVTAKRLGLDVFAKQIYCVIRHTKEGPVMAIQTGIDGYRAIAARTNEYDGQDGPFWCGEDGQWRDAWLPKEPPRAAKVLVYRKGSSRAFIGVATWDSYVQVGKETGPNGKPRPTGKWADMPDVMLAKCAEALALRKAFPLEMGGVYVEDEIANSNAIDVPSVERIVTAKPAEPEVDPWVPFLAELATVPGAAQFADAFGADVTAWTEEEIVAAFQRMFADADTVRALNTAVGPWVAVIDRHAKGSTRIAKLKESIGGPYKARTAQLRASEQAQNGGQS
jgi:phage recombination protein Bet